MQINVLLGDPLFEFSSFQKWVNKGQSWYANCGVPARHTTTIDANGRICTIGRDFEIANEMGAFPIVVYETFAGEPRS